MSKRKQHDEQSEKFDASSLEDLIEVDKDEYQYEYLEDDAYETIDEEDEQEKTSIMNQVANSLNLSGKGKLVLSVAIIIGVVILIVFNPLGKDDTATAEGDVGEKQGFFKMLFSKSENDMFRTEEEDLAGMSDIELIMYELQQDFPDYSVIDNGDNTITLTGETAEGVHTVIYDGSGAIVSETVGGQSIIEENPTGGSTEGTTGSVGSEEEETTGETTPTVDIKEYQIPDDSVLIKKSTYDKSIHSLPIQSITEEYDSNDRPVKKETKSKAIIQYEKLPLYGKVPMIFSQVIETGEKIIFTVPVEQYMRLEDKGTTVIEYTETEIHGTIVYEGVKIVDWQR